MCPQIVFHFLSVSTIRISTTLRLLGFTSSAHQLFNLKNTFSPSLVIKSYRTRGWIILLETERKQRKEGLCLICLCALWNIDSFLFLPWYPKGDKLFHLFGGRSSDSRPFCGWCLLNWAFIRHLNWFGWSTEECSTQVKSTIKCHSRPFSWKQQYFISITFDCS